MITCHSAKLITWDPSMSQSLYTAVPCQEILVALVKVVLVWFVSHSVRTPCVVCLPSGNVCRPLHVWMKKRYIIDFCREILLLIALLSTAGSATRFSSCAEQQSRFVFFSPGNLSTTDAWTSPLNLGNYPTHYATRLSCCPVTLNRPLMEPEEWYWQIFTGRHITVNIL